MSDPRRTRRWQQLRLAILVRDQHRCQLRRPGCLGAATEADHILPIDAGGPVFDPANLRAACKRCNSSAGAVYGNQKRATTASEHRLRRGSALA